MTETVEDCAAPISLYRGKVMHARLRPRSHRFTYRVASMLIDLDRLDDASRVSPLFSVNRRNCIAFHECDYGPMDGSSLRRHANRLVSSAGLPTPSRVELLCYPRVFGYVFNPISVYFCRDADERVSAIIYEVHNTFGERHSYVEPVRDGQATEAGIRQECDKEFFVSPFLAMEMRYRFRIVPPAETVSLRILETDSEGPILAATFHGIRAEATTGTLVASILHYLGITWKVTAGIHLEALRLWLKGIELVNRPVAPTAQTSISGPEPARPIARSGWRLG